MLRIISILVLILFIVLLPPAVLAYASQDALPGEGLYPVKRKLEDIILSLSTINPTTKAWFALAYSRRRFQETTSLIDKKENTAASKTLTELVSQTQSVASQIKQVNDPTQKKQLSTELRNSVTEYKQGLDEAQKQLNQGSITLPSPTPEASLNPIEQATPTIAPSPTPNNNSGEISNEELARQIEDAKKALEQASASTPAANAPPSPDDSDLYSAMNDLNGIDVTGLGTILNSSTQNISSFITQ